MLLFCKDDIRKTDVIIPVSRVFEIIGGTTTIIINYDGGELTEVYGKMERKIESIRITFENPEDVAKTLRQFYKATNTGARAFFFG